MGFKGVFPSSSKTLPRGTSAPADDTRGDSRHLCVSFEVSPGPTQSAWVEASGALFQVLDSDAFGALLTEGG